jgi:PAS domain S-box-containing protein
MQLLDELHEVALVRTDDRGVITGWNAGAARLLGYTRDEIVGKNRRVLYRDADSWTGRSTSVMKNVAEGGRMESEDWRVTRDGKHIWVTTSITPFHTDGELRGYVEAITAQSAVQRSADGGALLVAELEKERRTTETLRSALEEFRVGSEETMNELRIIAAALRKEIDRRKSLEEELHRLNARAAAGPPPAVDKVDAVEEEIVESSLTLAEWKRLGDAGAAEILRQHAAADASGTLLFVSGEQRKEIFFEKGRVFSCASNDPAKFLAQRLLETSAITEEQRHRALEIKRETDLPLGRILLILDAITEEQLVKMMRGKVEDEVGELLDWTDGEWAFDGGPVPSLKLVPLRIEVETLLESVRRRSLEVVIVSTRSRKMHRESCISARRVSSVGLRVFYGEEEAEAAGFEKCRQCFR